MWRLCLLCFLFFTGEILADAESRYRGMTNHSSDPQDLADLAETKANLVGYQLLWGSPADTATKEEYDAWLDGTLGTLDVLLETCSQTGLKMLIVLHSPPGGFLAGAKPARHRLFSEQWAQAALIETWQKIATRYAGHQAVWGYDILGEPAQKNVAAGLMAWSELAPRLVSEIRAIDSGHTIVVEPVYGNAAFLAKLPLIDDPAIVYSFHTYFPARFVYQGLNGGRINVKYPDKKVNKRKLFKLMSKAVRFQKKRGVQLMVGEFSAPRWAPGKSAYRFLKDHITIFEKQGWHWLYHVWREADIFSVEHGSDPGDPEPSPTMTDRERLLRSYFDRN